jgi:hypothetical protein
VAQAKKRVGFDRETSVPVDSLLFTRKRSAHRGHRIGGRFRFGRTNLET